MPPNGESREDAAAMKRAVLYLRSSKDRSDVSIDAQRRELAALADARGSIIVDEFADVVISGKDENRPAFQALLRALKSSARTWSAILMLDTSRLARSQYVAHVFRHEAQKRGVDVIFAKTPEVDGIAGIILPAVLHAMDEVHSFMSREKGLAGMAENVRQGWRAGGRAPFGYRLERIETGAVRDGEPVTKSRLAPDPETFDRVAAFLKGRAASRSRRILARELALEISDPSLVGVERNALVYAGHTVWNSKRGTAPREAWVIQKATHPAAITDAEAEAILAHHGAPKRLREGSEAYLLAGILRAADGRAWHGCAGDYRLGAKHVSGPRLETAVLEQVAADLRSPGFARALVKAAKAARPRTEEAAALAELEAEIRRLDGRARAFAECLPQTTAKAAIFAQIEETERLAQEARRRAERLKAEAVATARLREVGEADVRVMLNAMAADLVVLDRGHLKDFLRQVLETVELEPGTAACRIHYRIAASGDCLASPRVRDEIPAFAMARDLPLPFRRLRAAA